MALSRGMCLLRPIRLSKGLTQDQLSILVFEKTGISMSRVMISQFENTKRPLSPEQMRAICLVMGCTEADLYEWSL